jgi:hypothetical protein
MVVPQICLRVPRTGQRRTFESAGRPRVTTPALVALLSLLSLSLSLSPSLPLSLSMPPLLVTAATASKLALVPVASVSAPALSWRSLVLDLELAPGSETLQPTARALLLAIQCAAARLPAARLPATRSPPLASSRSWYPRSTARRPCAASSHPHCTRTGYLYREGTGMAWQRRREQQ